jgi:microcystin-dependent protein
MANVKISDLTAASAVADANQFEINEAGSSKRVTASQVKSYLTSSDLDMGGNKVLFGNVYSALSDLPSASTYHGMFAHVHATGKAYFGHNSAWVELANMSDVGAGVPSGVICMWGGAVSAIPSGWYLCDGNNSTPDLRDRFIVGSGTDSGGTHDINDTGGANSVTLSESNLPAHTHGSGSLATSSAGAHTHSMSLYADHWSGSYNIGGHRSSYVGSGTTSSAGAHTHSMSGSTASTGSGSAVENRPAFYALAYIQKG